MIGKVAIRVERFIILMRKLWLGWCGNSGQVYFANRITEYNKMWEAVASDINAVFSVLENDIWKIALHDKETIISNHMLEFDNPVVLEVVGRKPLVNRLLKQHGIPVTDHIVFDLEDLEKGYAFLLDHPHGCVIKPINGSAGRGITTHILTRREVRRAALLASLYCKNMIMEPMIAGESYRVLILNGKMIEAVKRRGIWIKGNGVQTIRELYNKNFKKNIINKINLDYDRDCNFNLQRKKYSLGTILEFGEKFLFKSVNDPQGRTTEVRTIYDEKVTNIVCESIINMSEMAAKILNSKFLGVDLITTDISLPLEVTGGVVNELNTTPALHHHYDIKKEKYPQVAIEVISTLLGVGINKT